MKKRIKDLTKEEFKTICSNHKECDEDYDGNCPFEIINENGEHNGCKYIFYSFYGRYANTKIEVEENE